MSPLPTARGHRDLSPSSRVFGTTLSPSELSLRFHTFVSLDCRLLNCHGGKYDGDTGSSDKDIHIHTMPVQQLSKLSDKMVLSEQYHY